MGGQAGLTSGLFPQGMFAELAGVLQGLPATRPKHSPSLQQGSWPQSPGSRPFLPWSTLRAISERVGGQRVGAWAQGVGTPQLVEDLPSPQS